MTVTEATELNFRLRHQRRDRKRRRHNADADQPDFPVDDHVLHDAAGIVGDAAIVAHSEVDAPAGDIAQRKA
jgi:hypothetical protein